MGTIKISSLRPTIIMASNIVQRVCVVFGYGPGLGAAFARKWIKEGYKVAIVARNEDKLKELEAKYEGGVTKGYPCDVTNRQQMEVTVEKIEGDLGPIHAVVYNAGSGVFKTHRELTLEEFDRSMRINTHGLFTAAQLICTKMEERGEGVLAVTGASASWRGKPYTAAFAAAKAAQRSLSQSLARDLGPKNIHVFYAVMDGFLDKNEEIGQEKPGYIDPNIVAETYWQLANQPKCCWTFEIDVRPSVENW